MIQEIWLIYQKEFDIIWGSEIEAIAISIIGKLFQDYESVDSYCQAYHDAYNEIINKLTNNNSG